MTSATRFVFSTKNKSLIVLAMSKPF
jgi:hypothetical protein